MNNKPYAAPNSNIETNESIEINNSPGTLFFVITIILVLINTSLQFIVGLDRGSVANALGYSFGAAHLFPLILIGIFSIWKSKRTRKTRTNIYFWVTFLTLLSVATQLIKHA